MTCRGDWKGVREGLAAVVMGKHRLLWPCRESEGAALDPGRATHPEKPRALVREPEAADGKQQPSREEARGANPAAILSCSDFPPPPGLAI